MALAAQFMLFRFFDFFAVWTFCGLLTDILTAFVAKWTILRLLRFFALNTVLRSLIFVFFNTLSALLIVGFRSIGFTLYTLCLILHQVIPLLYRTILKVFQNILSWLQSI